MSLAISSANSGVNNLWSLLASRSASSASSTGSSCAASTRDTTSASTAAPRPDGPPPPPAQFDSAMSTQQFARMGGGMAPMGPPPGEDPIASLDADDDGSVSADEFGLDGASDDVQKLFAAMDADGSGALSSDEIATFREQMTGAEGGRPPEPPMGPPPGTQSGASDTAAEDDTAAANAAAPDISSFLQQLAQRYASMTSTASEAPLSVTA
ncbi:MAG: hypothetical protein U1F53_04890 [Burkholderiaceae bacterium]